jgi:hypothetical protein
MGQQETMTVAVQEKETKGGAFRRMMLVLLVAALMVATMVLSAGPAMAENVKGLDGKRPTASGDILAPQHNGASVFHEGSGADVFVHGHASGNDGEAGQGN